MRDPQVLALRALHLSEDELEAILAGRSIERPVWPPQACQGAVVGLCAGGRVIGEALLCECRSLGGRVAWHFEHVAKYLRPVSHASSIRSRAASSPMPETPIGTMSQPRESSFDW